MKQCVNCQTEVADSANFCHICGGSEFSPISSESAPAEEVRPESGYQETGYKQPADPGPYYTDAGLYTPPMTPKKPSKGLIIGCMAGVAVLIVAIVAVVILTNPVRRFMNSIEEGNSIEASQIYYNSIYGNARRSEKFDAELSTYADKLLTMYLNQEIPYDELTAKLWAVDAAGVYNETVYTALQHGAYVYECRETFTGAQQAMSDGDYALAIALFSEVAGGDFAGGEEATAMLANATSLYRDEVLSAVDEYISQHNFDPAYALLNEAFYTLPGDAALESAYEQCAQAQYDFGIDQIIAEVQVYYGTNDYLSAIAFLDEQIGYYPDEVRLQDEQANCLTLFEEYVINESFRLASEGNFEHAASLAASGLSCFESAKVTELYQIYLSYIPVVLGEMEIFKNDTEGGSWASYTDDTDEYFEDKFGNTYAHSLSVGCGSLTYLVNFKYQTFTGTVAFPKSLSADDARESATLTIYGDGQEIAIFRDITDTTKPEAFSLDISSYEQITLTWTCEGYNVWEDWGDFATIFDGILTPIPLELPTSVN